MLYLGAELALKRPEVRGGSRVPKRIIFLRNYGSGRRTKPSARKVAEILSCRFIMSAGRAWRPGIPKTVDIRVGTGENDSGLANYEFTVWDLEDLGRFRGLLLGDGMVVASLAGG